MNSQSIAQICEWCSGRLVQGDATAMVASVSTDTRTIAPGSLFVALAGENFDAHQFLPQASQQGGAAFLISRELPSYPPGAVILVPDTLLALQALAKAWREVWGGKVIGLTGSNGKTSTKDFVTSVLSQEFNVNATKGNLNNHIGVPLSVLATNTEHTVGVFEMGMNHPGEIAPLAAIARPDAGIITNIGTAHIEHMGSREAIALEKGMLAEAIGEDGCVILNADDAFTPSLRERTQAHVLTAGFHAEADIRVSDASMDGSGSQFLLHLPHHEAQRVHLPIPGKHMIGNAALAAAAGYHFGLTAAQIVQGLERVQLNKGRLQIRIVNGVTFLDDAYNANPDSMEAALETLQQFDCTGQRIVVLGRMGERGAHAAHEHRELGASVARRGFPILCTVGDDDSRLIAEGAAGTALKVHSFSTHAACAAFLKSTVTPNDLVLVKGSRAAAMESVIEHFAH
jgi:UDP-N-acetylmuramoyl-tripeptide--D-alanyl-D-alanine ligase